MGSEWTGAVGNFKPAAAFESELVLKALSEIQLKAPAALIFEPEILEFLLYAAVEWGDVAAGARLKSELTHLGALILKEGPAHPFSKSAADIQSRLIHIFCEAAAFFKCEDWHKPAQSLIQFLEASYDPERGAFGDQEATGPAFAAKNALTAWAFLRAWLGLKKPELKFKAEQALKFIRSKLYDPLLGLVHSSPACLHSRSESVPDRLQEGFCDPAENRALEYGLLGDCSWAALAFSEAYLQTGDKSHRDFADTLVKYLLQELWDRERGGFLARPGSETESSANPSQTLVLENAAAFEALWRLRYIKGNNAYSKWVDLGLHRFLDGASFQMQNASLLRVQDMLAKGRLELEIVGRPADDGSQKILEALACFYAPRKIISFIDPDDQDYILAHGLEAPSYPRLFGCVDLKRCADTANPSEVGAVLNAIWFRDQKSST